MRRSLQCPPVEAARHAVRPRPISSHANPTPGGRPHRGGQLQQQAFLLHALPTEERFDMPGVGVGGLISNMLNPGLDQQLARAITPNRTRWRRRVSQGADGRPAAWRSQSPQVANLAPAAVTPMDRSIRPMRSSSSRRTGTTSCPTTSTRTWRGRRRLRHRAAAGEQDQRAARHGRTSPDNTLGALAKIQGMQDVTRRGQRARPLRRFGGDLRADAVAGA